MFVSLLYDNFLEKIGDSFEGREINVFKINAKNKDLPAVIIDAGSYGVNRIC